MTDNDDTPPIHMVTDESTSRGHAVPMSRDLAGPDGWMGAFAQLERRTEAMERRLDARLDSLGHVVESLVASRDTGRKLLWLIIPALVGALVSVLVFSAEKIAASSEQAGKQAATIDALKEQVQQQRDDIRELRAALRRQSGNDHQPTSDVPAEPDRLSLGTPASRSSDSGRVALHWPKLQNLQLGTSDVHSIELLQIRPQLDGGGGTTTLGASAGDEAQATIDTTRTVLSIPHL